MGTEITSATRRGELVAIARQLNADMAKISKKLNATEAEIPRALDRVAPEDLAALTAAIVALRQPASELELQSHLAVLVGSFPNAPKSDLTIYGAALLEDVADMKPSRYAIMRACRQLRRTTRFLPIISEVLEAVREVEGALGALQDQIDGLPNWIESKRNQNREWHQRQLVECFYRLERLAHDASPGEEATREKRRAEIEAMYNAEIVAKAWARVEAGCWYSTSKGWMANGKPWTDPETSLTTPERRSCFFDP
jgi:hypothetical protein